MATAGFIEHEIDILNQEVLLPAGDGRRRIHRESAGLGGVDRKRAERLLTREIEHIGSGHKWPPDPIPLASEFEVTRIITAAEEVALFLAMNSAKYRANRLRALLSYEKPSLALMDEIEQLLAYGTSIRNRLVEIFMKLGVSIARRLANAEYPVDELISEANVTLLRAVDRFDADRGYRFSTYATHAIRRNLIRYLTNRRKQLCRVVPMNKLDDVADGRKWTWRYERDVSRATAALDRLIGQLQPRDQLIVRSRFGLGEENGKQTLQSIADTLGVSRERIRQLECRATARLQTMAREQMLTSMDV